MTTQYLSSSGLPKDLIASNCEHVKWKQLQEWQRRWLSFSPCRLAHLPAVSRSLPAVQKVRMKRSSLTVSSMNKWSVGRSFRLIKTIRSQDNLLRSRWSRQTAGQIQPSMHWMFNLTRWNPSLASITVFFGARSLLALIITIFRHNYF